MKDKLATVIKESTLSPGLKSGDEVRIVYAYTYNNDSWCMVKRVSDKTRHEVLVSCIKLNEKQDDSRNPE